MKRIMVLGGLRYAIPVIRSAHEMGAYVITADFLPDNIAHQYSDEYCNVSIVEKELVLKKARELNIDGIISFACDPGVVTAAYVAEKIGLPSPGPYESICILQNKKRFRQFLAEHGFRTPVAKGFVKIDDALTEMNQFQWPVIVKPVDSAGSKGVKRVNGPDELREAVTYALSYSRKKEFIIEEYIAQKGFSSDSDCFSVDGSLKFVTFNSQRFDSSAENPYTPAGYSWPSCMADDSQKELRNELQRLITLLGMRTSIYNIETREGMNGRAYIMECSPRGGGNRLAECLEYATGVKLVENAVRAALGMEIIGLEQKPYHGHWAEVVLHSDKGGKFRNLWISDEIRGNVIEQDLWVKPGTRIGSFKAADQSIGTLILRFDTDKQSQYVMNHIDQFVKVCVS